MGQKYFVTTGFSVTVMTILDRPPPTRPNVNSGSWRRDGRRSHLQVRIAECGACYIGGVVE
jgi:hypothetical protein